MPIGSQFRNDLLLLIFNATPIANIADNASASPLTNLHNSLHTADPEAAGSQTTSEATYGDYARVPSARTSGGWTVSANVANPVDNIDFPQASGGSETATHWMIGTDAAGAGKQLFSGVITPSISISENVTPRLTQASSITLT